MFKFTDLIKEYNKLHPQKSLDPHSTWGLHYLEPEQQVFLDAGDDNLVKKAVRFYSPYSIDRTAIRADIAEAKEQHGVSAVRVLLALTKKVKQQLMDENPIVQGYEWELATKKMLDNSIVWSNFAKVTKSEAEKQQLNQLQQDWQKHQSLHLHSSIGLVFLLYMIIKYQSHFGAALKELRKNQKRFFKRSRMPPQLAKAYEAFLLQQLNYLQLLRQQVLDAILLRLKTASEQNNVAFGQVTSHLIEKLQQIGCINPAYPTCPLIHSLDPLVFNQLHNAVERHGSLMHRQRLHQLAWYQNAEKVDIAIIPTRHLRLLAPKRLMSFVPYSIKKPRWLFGDNNACFQFFEDHRQLFANITFAPQLSHTIYKLDSLSTKHPFYQQMINHYQIAIAAQKKAETEHIPWWQFKRKELQKRWRAEIKEYTNVTQENILKWINNLQAAIECHPTLPNNKEACRNFWIMINQLNVILRPHLTGNQQSRLESDIQQLAKGLNQAPINEWINVLEELADNPATVSEEDKNFTLIILKQLQLLDKGKEPDQQTKDRLCKTHGTATVKKLLSHIKENLKIHSDTSKLNLDMQLVAQLDPDIGQRELWKYIDKWFLSHSQLLVKSFPQRVVLAKQLHFVIMQHGSPLLKAHFNDWSTENIEQDCKAFVKVYLSVSKLLACRYTDRYTEKACNKLDQFCNEKLKQAANNDSDKLRIYHRVIQRMIDSNKKTISEANIEPHEVIVKSWVVEGIIALKAKLPFFKKNIKQVSSIKNKNLWLDALTYETSNVAPDATSLTKKRFYHTS